MISQNKIQTKTKTHTSKVWYGTRYKYLTANILINILRQSTSRAN